MIDIKNRKMLEHEFAENFASPYFPILAEIYLQDGDLQRVIKVCEVGLEHDCSNVDGKFILAKAFFLQNNLL